MVNTLPAPQDLITDTWITASWTEFLMILEHPALEKARCYYDSGLMRIETIPIGFAHGRDNSTLASVITLYGTLKNISFLSITNGSFRKKDERECQPDLAYYIGTDIQQPTKNNQSVNVDQYGPPTLVIEIASTTLSDDLGQKRLLYERLGVQEYWVVDVDVDASAVIAFSILNGGSRQIYCSEVLPELSISVVEEALRRSQTDDDGTVNRWLLQQFV